MYNFKYYMKKLLLKLLQNIDKTLEIILPLKSLKVILIPIFSPFQAFLIVFHKI